MSHGLMNDRMAYVGDVPWHGLGTKVPATINAADMIVAAGLDWRVWKQPAPGARLLAGEQASYERFLVMRDATAKESQPVALGMVGPGYRELQNRDAFAFFQPLIDEGFAQFHTAGALYNGERIWVMAKLRDQITIGTNDAIDRYLLLSSSHDGSSAVSVSFTPVRVVCQNTLNLAMQDRKSAITISHTRHMPDRLLRAQADQLRHLTKKVFEDAHDLFGQLAAHSIKGNPEDYLERLFPPTPLQKERGETPDRWRRILAILDDTEVTPTETRNTLWALYNAVVHDEDYRQTRERDADARLNRIWFGSGQALKVKALAVAGAMAKAPPP
jgi:phage/plasmid-like protein (TIGR03299 family)